MFLMLKQKWSLGLSIPKPMSLTVQIFFRLTNADLPPEVLFRLEELWETTKVIGKKVVHTGRNHYL